MQVTIWIRQIENISSHESPDVLSERKVNSILDEMLRRTIVLSGFTGISVPTPCLAPMLVGLQSKTKPAVDLTCHEKRGRQKSGAACLRLSKCLEPNKSGKVLLGFDDQDGHQGM